MDDEGCLAPGKGVVSCLGDGFELSWVFFCLALAGSEELLGSMLLRGRSAETALPSLTIDPSRTREGEMRTAF